MKIEKYGVELTRLTYDKIELVRQWRNSEHVRRYMIFQDEITPEMQKKWFATIDNDFNYYFVISYNGEDIGLSNVKDIDSTYSKGEVGIFIANLQWLCSDIPVRVALCGTDFCFEQLGLEELNIHIRKDNERAIRFNMAFGFVEQKTPDQNDVFVEMTLNKANYYIHREKLVEILN